MTAPEAGGWGRARERADGWDSRRRGAFLKVLNDSKDVRAACAAAGMSSTAAYALRGRSPAFAKAWEKALAKAVPSVLDAARERAIHGWTEPIVAGGKVIGERRRFSDSLLKAMVDREGRAEGAEKKSARDKAPPRPRSQKARVELAWEAARAAGGYFHQKPASEEETNAAIMAKLDAVERRRAREMVERHLADWRCWQAGWTKWGRQRPRPQPKPLRLGDLRAGEPGVRVIG